MGVSHSYPAISATFDDPNLVSCAGLAPTMALAHRAALGALVADTLTLKAKGGVNAPLKACPRRCRAPVIAATRVRRGGSNSARGAARIVSDALATAKACGAGGLVTVRADSA